MRSLIVGQSGGPTAVINASLAGVIDQAKAFGIDRILGMRRGVEGLLAGDIVDLSHFDSAALDQLARTPGAALGSCRHKLDDCSVNQALEQLRKLDAEMFCYIGGNDSADTTNLISSSAAARGLSLRAIAVPKTIDNDLPETDHCPGYGSAARYIATAVAESTLDTRSLPTNYPVKIIEVMGRDAGWLAAAAGLGRIHQHWGPHLIYVPELPFDPERFVECVAEIHSQVGYVVIVVAETIRDLQGNAVGGETASIDMFGHPIVRGAAQTLVRWVEDRLKLAAKSEKPGSLQRSSYAMQSPVDLHEAREAGRESVRLASSGQTGLMVTIKRTCDTPYQTAMSSVPIERIANRQRCLPREFLDVSGTNVTEAFRAYALPLLGPEPIPSFTKLF